MATWNTDAPAVGNEISADIPDIEENFQELHDVITAITNGTLGTTTAANFKVDSLADGTTGFASTTTQPFYQNAAPTGWTRNSALTDNSMFMYAAAGNVATGGAVDAKAAHTHTGPSHNHQWYNYIGTTTTAQLYDTGGDNTNLTAITNSSGVHLTDYNGSSTSIGFDAYTTNAGTGATGSNTAPYYIEMILAAVD